MAHIGIEQLTDEENEQLGRSYIPVKEKKLVYIRTKPGNSVLPDAYVKYKEAIFNLEVRPDDVYVLTYPKCGTTWTQELAWCLLHDVDLEKAKKIELSKRSPFLEESVITDYIVKQGLAIPKNAPTDMALNFDNSVEKAHKLSSPRLLKSHLPFCTLPDDAFKKGKVILCLRNPKDTVVSYFHHEKLVNFQWFLDDFKASFDIFMNDLMPYGSYWSYTLAAWEKRNHPNVCLLFFEDMKQDLKGSVRKVASFLDKDLSSEQVEALVEHLSFKKMKGNTAVNKEQFKDFGFADKGGSFMRKGQIGDWKNYLTDEMNQRMDEAIEKHFKGTGLEFRYE